MKSFLIFIFVLFLCPWAMAQEVASPVEINGDEMQYSAVGNTVTATGNVVVKRDNVTMFCDRLEFDRGTNVGIAQGHVILERDGARLTGDKMVYNFTTMKGDFIEAQVTSKPFYGAGREVSRLSKEHVQIRDGYITTCDHDRPHFRFQSSKIDVFPGDKAVARNMRLKFGGVPVFYLPRYTQDLRDNKPMFFVIPGYTKDWGAFFLTGWRHRWNDYVDTVVHADYRSRRDLAEGVDVNYHSPDWGQGFMKAYYTHERFKRKTKFFFDTDVDDPPAIEKERFKVEWRHAWDINEKTRAVWQYFKTKDDQFLKDFSKREYERDGLPPTYFLLTRGFDQAGTLAFRSDVRVNRFVAGVERLPEVNYLLPGRRILGSGFYWKNSTAYSNLTKLQARPMTNRYETQRVDMDNEISYPFQWNILNLRPFAGIEQTYYSKTLTKENNNTLRGIFKTGFDVSTRFSKIYDVQTEALFLDIHRLRHIVTPSLAYFYSHHPTLEASKLVQFDGVDQQTLRHGMTLGLENKLQTQRNGQGMDLLRFEVTSDFYLKEDSHPSGFNNVMTKTDFIPNQRLRFYADTYFDTLERHFQSANFDIYINDEKDRWSFSIGKRYERGVDDQLTSQLNYRINQKWFIEIYQRWDIDRGIGKEQHYAFVRDLHEWEGKVALNHKDASGDEIWLIFTLKEFPDMGINIGTSYNRRKTVTP